ncbi:YveK family protein [Brevibacillus ginsengisoli]|uniref:YveK family protein n=1 Tax=Brevibacillus ginsengisoli TaxID=363854 RepID=UPI003CF83037
MENIDLIAIGKMSQKRIWLILFCIVLSVSLSGYVSFRVLVPAYEAQATIVVQGQNPSELYNDVRANQELVKTYSAIIKSRKIAEEVLTVLKLDKTSDELLKQVRVQETEQSLVTTIIVTDHDPKLAASIANEFARSFQKNIRSIMKVDNVAILDEASTSANYVPVSPKPYINMAVAFFVALLFSLGISFFLEFLDKTIRREEQIEQSLGIPVLGVIHTINPKKAQKNRQERGVSLEG